MTNFTKLIESAEKKNYKCIFNENENNKYIGITKKNNVYHWFKISKHNNFGVEFSHSYSCNNGKTYKGFRHSFKIKCLFDYYKNFDN
jgi:hypothetical protein